MEEQIKKYDSIFEGIELGIGTWAWGDRLVWGYGNQYAAAEVEDTFHAAIENGIRFFDTAEVYGQGKSEKFIGQLLPKTSEEIRVATKIMPFPWRLGKKALKKALQASLGRLNLTKVDLYQVHWPMPPVSIESWMDQMADAYADGLVSAVGVSNYDLDQTKRAADALQKRGLTLASNQVEYHLLERRIEKNGLVDFCKSNGIKIIAYSPLAMGILSGKYTPNNPPKGTRSAHYNRALLEEIQPLIKLMKSIGMDREGKTAAQVAINWVVSKGALAIPGAKNIGQVEQNAGAIGWRLSDDEINRLDVLSDKISKVLSNN